VKFFGFFIIILVAGCFSPERSISGQLPYFKFIGARYVSTEAFFLTERGGERLLQREKKSSLVTGPTLEEFKRGEWDNERHGRQYLKVLPEGTIFEICDVTYEFHVEAGHMTNWYVRIAGQGSGADNPPIQVFVRQEGNKIEIPGMKKE
jgi:hypothetical protein